jgi:ubiquinone/menaquinone biosynthesis C-methylase UbiE
MKRSHKEDKLAKVYDAEILPIWSRRFGRLLLRDLALPPKAMVLDVGCGTGYPALEILRRMDGEGRIIAIDQSSPMLDEARVKAGRLSGKRIFFRSEAATPKLTFADDVYDLVVCNAGLDEIDDPEGAIRDFVRVAKPGGRVAVTMPLAGTFNEFYDLFREVLHKLDRGDALDRLEEYLAQKPPLEQLEAWLEGRRAGRSEVGIRQLYAAVQVEPRVLLRAADRVRAAVGLEGDRRQRAADARRLLAPKGGDRHLLRRPAVRDHRRGRLRARSQGAGRRSAPPARSRRARRGRAADGRGRAGHRRLRRHRRAREAGARQRRRTASTRTSPRSRSCEAAGKRRLREAGARDSSARSSLLRREQSQHRRW